MKKQYSNDVKKLLGKPIKPWEIFHEHTVIPDSTEEIKYDQYPEEWLKTYYKGYVRMPIILLPKPKLSNTSLEQALSKRQSTREYKDKALSKHKLSTLLYYTGGVNTKLSGKRYYPSGGARYPLEMYLISLNTRGVDKGIYHYYLRDHFLEKIRSINSQFDINNYFIHKWVKGAGVILVFTSIYKRSTVKYDNKGYNISHIEAGHAMQNAYLLSASLGIGCCAIKGYYDRPLSRLLRLNRETEKPIYACGIGSM